MTFLAHDRFLRNAFKSPDRPPRHFEEVAASGWNQTAFSEETNSSLASVWAAGAVFRGRLVGDNTDAQKTAAEAWFALLGAFVLKKLFPRRISPVAFQREEPALFNALVATDSNPSLAGKEDYLFLGSRGGTDFEDLADDTIVSAWYRPVGFFPAPDRAVWESAGIEKEYLKEAGLSWHRVVAELRALTADKREHFALVVALLLGRASPLKDDKVKRSLDSFRRNDVFLNSLDKKEPSTSMPPEEWPITFHTESDPEALARELLTAYPLQLKQDGVTVYLLVSGLDESENPWIGVSPHPGDPAPKDYTVTAERRIEIRVEGGSCACTLQPDEVVLSLKDHRYLVHDVVPARTANYQLIRRDLHQTREARGGLVIAPVSPRLASLISDASNGLSLRRADATWTLTLGEATVSWASTERRDTTLGSDGAYVDIWPAWRAPSWRFHAVRSSRRSSGQPVWLPIASDGHLGRISEIPGLPPDEALSAIGLDGNGRHTFSGALGLSDGSGRITGCLFLSLVSKSEVPDGKRTSLSVDFGTSNTCVAAVDAENTVRTLVLPEQAQSARIIGERRASDFGFFSEETRKSGVKGFFASLLLTPQSWPRGDGAVSVELLREAVIACTIPSLRGFDDQLDGRALAERGWALHDQLKWEASTVRREVFLTLVTLIAQAEVFARYGMAISKYAFTYPLALRDPEAFKKSVERATAAAHSLAFGVNTGPDEVQTRIYAESQAILRSTDVAHAAGYADVFLDLGAGTADLAVVSNNKTEVLDSLEVAGRNFFDIWWDAAESPEPAAQMRREKELPEIQADLNRLLGGYEALTADQVDGGNLLKKLAGIGEATARGLNPSVKFSLLANQHPPDQYEKRCAELTANNAHDHQRFVTYRARVFFRQILGWAVGQALIATIRANAPQRIRFYLSGNGWGLLMFAGVERSAAVIGDAIRDIAGALAGGLDLSREEAQSRIERVDILSEGGFVRAKEVVAQGAAHRVHRETSATETKTGGDAPFTAVAVPVTSVNGKHLGNNASLPFSSRWSETDILAHLLGDRGGGILDRMETTAPYPGLDSYLQLANIWPNVETEPLDEASLRALNDQFTAQTSLATDNATGTGRRFLRPPVNRLLEERMYPSREHRKIFETIWSRLRPQ